MRSYIKKNLTAKLFILVCSALIGASLLICGLFAVTMPKSYVEIQNEGFDRELNAIIETLADKPIQEAEDTLSDFAKNKGVYLELHSAHTGLVDSFGDMELSITYDITGYQDGGDITAVENDNMQMRELLIDGETYVLVSFGNVTQSINQVTLILQDTIPFIIVVMIGISFLISLFLSRFITKPIKAINENAKKIADLSFNVHCTENRNDELGELAKNINLLSSKLDTALSSLQDELEKEKVLEESQRLFFAAASHELKTPLTVIKGNLEGMIYGYKDYEDKDAYIAKTLRTATQMEHLIGEILAFSAMRGNEYVLNTETFDLSNVVEELMLYFAEIIEIKGFIVVTDLESVNVKADKKLFTKALQNIISNALHYSPENETIKVVLTEKTFIVENTGVRISDEDIGKLFDPFYRVDKSRSRQTGGSGLGLYFVKTILEKHNFEYSMTSEDDKVTFGIFL